MPSQHDHSGRISVLAAALEGARGIKAPKPHFAQLKYALSKSKEKIHQQGEGVFPGKMRHSSVQGCNAGDL